MNFITKPLIMRILMTKMLVIMAVFAIGQTICCCDFNGNCVESAEANNDVLPDFTKGQDFIIGSVATNDTECACGTTTYALTPFGGNPTNGVNIVSFAANGDFEIQPILEGVYTFSYDILCDGNVMSMAQVSGNCLPDNTPICGIDFPILANDATCDDNGTTDDTDDCVTVTVTVDPLPNTTTNMWNATSGTAGVTFMPNSNLAYSTPISIEICGIPANGLGSITATDTGNGTCTAGSAFDFSAIYPCSSEPCAECVVILCEPIPTGTLSDKACGSMEKVYKEVAANGDITYYKDDACTPGNTVVLSDFWNIAAPGNPQTGLPEFPCTKDDGSLACWNHYSGQTSLEHQVFTDDTGNISFYHAYPGQQGTFTGVIDLYTAANSSITGDDFYSGFYPDMVWCNPANACEYWFNYRHQPSAATLFDDILLEGRAGSNSCCPNTQLRTFNTSNTPISPGGELTIRSNNSAENNEHGVFICPDADGDLCVEQATLDTVVSSTGISNITISYGGAGAFASMYFITGDVTGASGTTWEVVISSDCGDFTIFGVIQ